MTTGRINQVTIPPTNLVKTKSTSTYSELCSPFGARAFVTFQKALTPLKSPRQSSKSFRNYALHAHLQTDKGYPYPPDLTTPSPDTPSPQTGITDLKEDYHKPVTQRHPDSGAPPSN